MKKILLGILLLLAVGWVTVGRVEGATFGWSTTPTEEDNTSRTANQSFGTKFTLSEAGTVTKVYIYCRSLDTPINVKACIWDDDGESGALGTLIAVSEPVTVSGTTKTWYEFTFNQHLEAGNWGLGAVVDNTLNIFDEAETGYNMYGGSNNYTTPTNHSGSVLVSNYLWNIYATYTPDGSMTVTKIILGE